MNKKYLFMMMGHAGSGKSYFARQLADDRGLVRLNGDSLRIAMYESLEEVTRYRDIDPTLTREKIFNSLNYMTAQILRAGYSVIYDANNNRRITRDLANRLAHENSAKMIVIWIQTSPELALQRGQAREELIDQRKFDEKSARETVERHIANTDEPSDDEKVIEIDGTAPFEEQYESFNKQLAELEDE